MTDPVEPPPWLTSDELAELWPDMPEDPSALIVELLLTASQDAAEAWLPAVGDPERPRDNTIKLGHFTLVRGIWNDAIGGDDGVIGGDGFDFNPPWLAREARRLMRPQRGGNSLATGHDE